MLDTIRSSSLGLAVTVLCALGAACQGQEGAAAAAGGDEEEVASSDSDLDSEEAEDTAAAPAPSAPASTDGETPADVVEPAPEDEVEACRPPPGVSGSPRTIEQAVVLMNSLPRPTTVACFIESLDRPLELYLTSSKMSAQPAAGERSPRTFIVLAPLFLSIVPEGEYASLVEMGQRTSDDRSIKAEVAFPLRSDVTADTLFEQIGVGDVSTCGGCHVAERAQPDDFFGEPGAFESRVIAPFLGYEVPLATLRAEADACDAQLEPGRCAILAALFSRGEIRSSNAWADTNF